MGGILAVTFGVGKGGIPQMALPEHILLVYGYLLLFGWVLIEQLGVPLPAMPVLLAAGALSSQHEINFSLALLAGLAASLIADSAWFLIGRKYGHHVLRILCKLSMEPAVCVRRTQDSFGRRRGVTLMIAKFVPGLATLAPPVAGENGMGFASFLLFDGIGSTLWLGALLAAGRFFGDLLKRNASLRDWAERFSDALLILGIAGFFVARLWRRSMALKELAAARLEPEDLKRMLDSGEAVYIEDLRTHSNWFPTPLRCPARSTFRLMLSPRASGRSRATAISCSFASTPARPPRPKPP